MPLGESNHSEEKTQTGFELQKCLYCRNKRCILKSAIETGTVVAPHLQYLSKGKTLQAKNVFMHT